MPIACEQIRNEFSALLDDELNSEDRELVEEHLSECAECLRELHGYKQVSDSYFYHHPVKAPDNFDELLKEALAPASASTGMGWSPWRMAAAAAIVLVAGGIGWRSLQDSPEAPMVLSSNLDQRTSQAESAPAEAPMAMTPESAMEEASTAASSDLAKDELAAPPAALGGRSADTAQSGFGGGAASNELPEAQRFMKQSAPAADAALPEAEAPAPAREMEQSDGVSIQAAPPASPPAVALADAAATAPLREESVAESKNDSTSAREAISEKMADADDVPAEEPRQSLLKRRMADESTIASADPVPGSVEWRDQSFSLKEGVLTQGDYGQEPLTVVQAPSESWTQLLDAHPDLAQLVDGTQDVIVQLEETWYRIAIATAPPVVAPTE